MANPIDIVNVNMNNITPLDLLNYENKTVELEYDDNGFLISQINSEDGINIYFQEGEHFYQDGSYSVFYAKLITKTDTEYIYSIQITESIPTGDFVALGTVKIIYDSNNKKISKIYVNDIEDGMLHDKYDDCFDVYPSTYIHLLKKY